MPIDTLPEIPDTRVTHDGEPGEFQDGRMGADIAGLISDITDKRNLLAKHTAEDNEQLAAVENEIELLEFRLFKIESRVEKRTKAKSEYEETYVKTEAAFNKIVSTANAVANILEPPTHGDLDQMEKPKNADNVKPPVKYERKEANQTATESKMDYNEADRRKALDASKNR